MGGSRCEGLDVARSGARSGAERDVRIAREEQVGVVQWSLAGT